MQSAGVGFSRVFRSFEIGFLLSLVGAMSQAPVQSQESNKALDDEVMTVRIMVTAGRYDEIIEKTTRTLDKMAVPDKRMVFLRGYAEWRINRLDAAKKDLQPLGDYALTKSYPTASKMVAEVDVLLELRPSNEHVVRINDRVVFHVYSSSEDELTQNVLESLPIGYKAASKFLEMQVQEIPVFVFNGDEYEQFFKFYSLLGEPPHPSWRFLSRAGTITISQRTGAGISSIPTVYALSRTVAHEMTHIFMSKTVIGVKDFPNWFNEGAAQVVAATMTPAQNRSNDLKMQRLY